MTATGHTRAWGRSEVPGDAVKGEAADHVGEVGGYSVELLGDAARRNGDEVTWVGQVDPLLDARRASVRTVVRVQAVVNDVRHGEG